MLINDVNDNASQICGVEAISSSHTQSYDNDQSTARGMGIGNEVYCDSLLTASQCNENRLIRPQLGKNTLIFRCRRLEQSRSFSKG